MATIIAHIRVKTGREAAFEEIARELFAVSHRIEKALRRYEYWRCHDDSSYYCLLSFNDFFGFMTHQSSAHHEAAAAPLMDVIAELRLEWIDPVQGASPLPATHPQPLPADADALVRRYAALMPVVMADWWAPLRRA